MDVSIEKMAEKLKEYQEFRIVYHIRPDGDCIGSSFALALALQSIGAKCQVTGRDEVPGAYRSMTDKFIADELINPVYVTVDISALKRTGNFQKEHVTFCIDHHRDNSVPADYKYVEPDCGACSEIILKLIKAMGIPVTKEIADLLYTALVTDTMCFRTSDTGIQSFETAAELARCGADTYSIGRKHMLVKSQSRLKIEQILSESFHFTCGNRILTGVITQNDRKAAGIQDSELEGINAVVEQVEGVRIGVVIREQPDGRTRCSIRTNGCISAHEIGAVYGGGGHFHAAGCELNANPDEARKMLEETCRRFL